MSQESFIKTPKQLIGVVVIAFIVPIIGIIMIAGFVESMSSGGAGSDAMTPKAIQERIAPVAQFKIDPTAAPQTTTAQAAAPAGAVPNTNSAAPAAPANNAPSPTPQVAAQAAAATPAAPAANVPAAQVAAANTPAAKTAQPPALFTQVCQACHIAGVAGAPKIGDKAAWAPRIALGVDALTASAIKGKGAMPPKGGSNASDADIKAVVQYMVDQEK